jgi:uncharacterized protein
MLTPSIKATYEVETVRNIVNTTPVLHVSFVPDPSVPAPVVLPMIGQMGHYPGDTTLDESDLACYLHGYVTSRIMKLSADAIERGEPGMPICVCATKVDGFVLSLTPNTHNYNYRSAVLHGHATVLAEPEGADEKLWAMKLVTNSVVEDRWDNSRVPPDNAEQQSTRILKVTIASASAKVREGVPSDERKDMKRGDVLDSIWTGVLPFYETVGEPQPGPYNRVKKVPEHVTKFVKETTERNKKYAFDAAHKPAPQKRKKPGDDA